MIHKDWWISAVSKLEITREESFIDMNHEALQKTKWSEAQTRKEKEENRKTDDILVYLPFLLEFHVILKFLQLHKESRFRWSIS